MKRNLTSRSTIVVVGLMLVAINLIGLNLFTRVDLTDDNVYSLTAASRDLVAELEDPVTITAYFTKNLPSPYGSNRRYLKDKLEDYKAFGGQNVQYRFVDPGDDESIQQDLNRFGIPPVQIQVVESDNIQLKNAYMGVGIQYEGDREVIPVVQDLSNLEYDITSAIRRLSRDELPVVGFLQGHGEPALSTDMRTLQQELSRNYTVQPVTIVGDRIIDRPDVLFVVAPTDTIPDPQLRALDDYLMEGGRLGLLINAVSADLRTSQASALDVGLGPMLRSYGIDISSTLVMDEQSSAVTMQRQQGVFSFAQQIPYAFFPLATRFGPNNMMVNRLREVVFYYVSAIDTSSVLPSTVDVEPLISSTRRSAKQQDFFFIQPMPDQRPSYSDGPFMLAAAYTGTFPSAFVDGRESPDSRIVVVGDGDFINESIIGAVGGNIQFALNAADWLIQDEALLGIRSKTIAPRALREVSDAARPWIKYANMIGPAVLIILFGVVRWRRRNIRPIILRTGSRP